MIILVQLHSLDLVRGSNTFYGNSSYSSGSTLYGNVNISSNQNVGFYDIEVYDYNTYSWVTTPDIFEVTQAPPSIHSISPNLAEQGELLSVNISTTNIALTDGSSTTSPFRLIQPSTNTVYFVNNTSITQGIGLPSSMRFSFFCFW